MGVILKLETDYSEAEISLFGAMTTAEFLVNDKKINPFYNRPWNSHETEDDFLQNLHGDFFCLPFGTAPMPHALDGAWGFTPAMAKRKEYPHGYSSHGEWTLVSQNSNTAQLRLEYANQDIREVQRKITLEKTSIYFEDVVKIERAVSLPVGIHPIFRLPNTNNASKLIIPECSGIHTFPINVDESSHFKNNIMFHDLAKVPCKDGETIDATQLPLPYAEEELLMLANVKEGKVVLQNIEEKYAVVLEWDKNKYQHCLLWMSNRGRQYSPWSGRNLCIGIEPITAPFDLGEGIGTSSNPLNSIGINTAFQFPENSIIKFTHKISMYAL